MKSPELPTPPTQPVVHPNEARHVMARHRGTCADLIPLVVRQDTVHENTPVVAYYHHDFYSLYLIRSGRGTHVIDGAAYGIAKGDVYVMGPGMTHHFPHGDRLLADTFHFTLDVFDGATQAALRAAPGFRALLVAASAEENQPPALGNRRWLHLTPSAHHEIGYAISELKAEWETGTALGAALTQGLFLRLLVALSRYAVQATNASRTIAAPPLPVGKHASGEAAVAQAVRFMDDHFPEPLRMEHIAARVFLSPDRFTHVFTQFMGRTPRDYLRHLRVERAKTLLATTNASLSEVARLSGFNEAAYLVRVIRAETGQTPRKFRLSAKGDAG